jgi:hypothetical protein
MIRQRHNISQNGCGGDGDEIETVKNSMINLLNVVIEGEGGSQDAGASGSLNNNTDHAGKNRRST